MMKNKRTLVMQGVRSAAALAVLAAATLSVHAQEYGRPAAWCVDGTIYPSKAWGYHRTMWRRFPGEEARQQSSGQGLNSIPNLEPPTKDTESEYRPKSAAVTSDRGVLLKTSSSIRPQTLPQFKVTAARQPTGLRPTEQLGNFNTTSRRTPTRTLTGFPIAQRPITERSISRAPVSRSLSPSLGNSNGVTAELQLNGSQGHELEATTTQNTWRPPASIGPNTGRALSSRLVASLPSSVSTAPSLNEFDRQIEAALQGQAESNRVAPVATGSLPVVVPAISDYQKALLTEQRLLGVRSPLDQSDVVRKPVVRKSPVARNAFSTATPRLLQRAAPSRTVQVSAVEAASDAGNPLRKGMAPITRQFESPAPISRPISVVTTKSTRINPLR